MSNNNQSGDFSHWIGIGVVAAILFWIVSKPRRILVFLAILGAGAFWANQEEQKAKVAKAQVYEQKVHHKKMQDEWENKKELIVWFQSAILIKAWEEYLITIPELADKRPLFEMGIDRSQGRKIAKRLRHSDIDLFVNTKLVDTLVHPVFRLRDVLWGNRTILLHEQDALEILHLTRDRDGLFLWDGAKYGQKAYDVLTPALFAPELDSLMNEDSMEQYQKIAASVYENYLNQTRQMLVQSFRKNELPEMIEAISQRIKRKDPNIDKESLMPLVLAKVEKSYKLRELLKRCPDYNVQAEPYFQ